MAVSATAQKYDGPIPQKPDLPYLKHGDTLVATEVAEAKEEKKKDDTLYTITPANSPVKTPLASPILIFKSDKLIPRNLQLFKFEVRNGRRELAFPAKKLFRKAIRIVITKLSPDNIWKIEVRFMLRSLTGRIFP